MTSLLILSLLVGESVTVVAAPSVADRLDKCNSVVAAPSVAVRLDKCDSEIGVGGERAFNLAAEEGGGVGTHITSNPSYCHIEWLKTITNKH